MPLAIPLTRNIHTTCNYRLHRSSKAGLAATFCGLEHFSCFRFSMYLISRETAILRDTCALFLTEERRKEREKKGNNDCWILLWPQIKETYIVLPLSLHGCWQSIRNHHALRWEISWPQLQKLNVFNHKDRPAARLAAWICEGSVAPGYTGRSELVLTGSCLSFGNKGFHDLKLCAFVRHLPAKAICVSLFFKTSPKSETVPRFVCEDGWHKNGSSFMIWIKNILGCSFKPKLRRFTTIGWRLTGQ